MSQPSQPEDSYASIMGGVVEWLVEVYEQRLSQAKEALDSVETILGGLGYEERAERLAVDSVEHPTPQRSLSRLANWFAEIERELEERRALILRQQWESMAGEYALVSMQNLTEARQYLGLAQSAVANLLVSLATNRLNAWEKQTKLYGVRLYMERVETAIVWAIESATNGLRQHQLDGGSANRQLPPLAPPPRISTGAVSYRAAPAPEPPPAPGTTSAPTGAAPAPGPSPSPMPGASAPPPEASGQDAKHPQEPPASGLFGRLRRRKRPSSR
jgi:hypothetical protein